MNCKIINNRNDYYQARKNALKDKYGERYQKGMHVYMVCENERCVNPQHMVAKVYALDDVGMKPCSVCGKWLPADKYYTDNTSVDGHSQKCMVCKTI